MTLRPFLRSRIDHLRVTAVESRYSLDCDAAVVLCPRLAWAAYLTEFECVEVRNLIRGTHSLAYVVYGKRGVVEFWTSTPSQVCAGDRLRLNAYAWEEGVRPLETTFVRVGRDNAPVEIRRVAARVAKLDPTFFPIQPRQDPVGTRSTLAARQPIPNHEMV